MSKKQLLKTKNKLITDIQNYARAYQEYLFDMGNECAATDRMIEHIVETAKHLEKIQEEHLSLMK